MLDTCCLQFIWTANSKAIHKHLPSVSITQTALVLACPNVDLLSSSISTDSEIQFYYNTFTARIARKLGGSPVTPRFRLLILCQGWQ